MQKTNSSRLQEVGTSCNHLDIWRPFGLMNSTSKQHLPALHHAASQRLHCGGSAVNTLSHISAQNIKKWIWKLQLRPPHVLSHIIFSPLLQMQDKTTQLVNTHQPDPRQAQRLQSRCPACHSSRQSRTLTPTGQTRRRVNTPAQRCKRQGGEPVLPTGHSSSCSYNTSSICYTSVCYQCCSGGESQLSLVPAIACRHLYAV